MRITTDRERLILRRIVKPDWARAMGRDRYGLWAEIAVELRVGKGEAVIQRLRWIPPGRFLMGSPEDEHDRNDDERQHEVILTRGFWLAETACTQALWEAVTGADPSHFKGERRPVESVSWRQAQGFVRRLNHRVPGLEARLPTEAEWEYACRAGTSTPFSFGEDIGPEQANFDGTRPYRGTKEGRFRRETVDAGSLPPNPWGLYEMHGNVWEWCRDRYGPYPEGVQVDPPDPKTGERRVLRGGSWINRGRGPRSAYRSPGEPGYRGSIVGFRLALGPELRREEPPA